MDLHSDADLVVVGSGMAGMTAALAAAEHGAHVQLLTAGAPLSGSSLWAQGGIAAAISAEDRPAWHEADTLAVGASLNDLRAVHVLVHDGRRAATQLLKSGVPFDGGPLHPELGLEAGHGRRRILHAGGGATGERVSSALLARVLDHPRITVVPETPVDALTIESGRVVGAASGQRTFRGRGVVLATGGDAGLWGRTTNPRENRGDGLRLAWSAGASLADLEFVQFHPTALVRPGGQTYLLSEALRGEGALLVDGAERPVIDPLLPRDVVARAIARHLAQDAPVYLSLRHLDAAAVVARFPNIAQQLQAWGLDLARDLLPVAPAAHDCMGGVRSDASGRTDVAGLYVAGEVACTGAQGANRLASNSLLECMVFGRRAALAALGDGPARHASWVTRALGAAPATSERPQHPSDGCPRDLAETMQLLGARLDRDLGVERDGSRLRALVNDLPVDSAGMSPPYLVAALAAQAALLRLESRGAHYRTDAPALDPDWQGRILWRHGVPPVFEEVTL
ncbi:MAG TPA: FAD-dependent oxidoreductase [Chloroflexia bacterium]|nr:FAD-dependent oxidoreductase [Chloroflexia bacterium]